MFLFIGLFFSYIFYIPLSLSSPLGVAFLLLQYPSRGREVKQAGWASPVSQKRLKVLYGKKQGALLESGLCLAPEIVFFAC